MVQEQALELEMVSGNENGIACRVRAVKSADRQRQRKRKGVQGRGTAPALVWETNQTPTSRQRLKQEEGLATDPKAAPIEAGCHSTLARSHVAQHRVYGAPACCYGFAWASHRVRQTARMIRCHTRYHAKQMLRRSVLTGAMDLETAR